MEIRGEKNVFVPPAELERQRKYLGLINTVLVSRYGDTPKAYVHTYGCQGNVSDSERIKGQLREMGYSFTDTPDDADLVLFNTCAVREHAEDRVFGNVGALKPIKEQRKNMIIVLCGCMMQQKHISERIKKSFPYVNLVFGTFAVHKLPEMLYTVLSRGKRVFEVEECEGNIAEGLPTERDRGAKAWLPIMYGCNNFCSYCIVPYVRDRERSRDFSYVVKEVKELAESGVKEITLLGQNVNSYGNDLADGTNFAGLLREICKLEGDFKVSFMTSHPKDLTDEVIEVVANEERIEKYIHLPAQSGNDRVLKLMNRKYTREKYLSIIEKIREKIPNCRITSDFIVGFPTETEEEFEDTYSLVKQVRFDSIFAFMYSPREGTVASKMEDQIPDIIKHNRVNKLLALEKQIQKEDNKR